MERQWLEIDPGTWVTTVACFGLIALRCEAEFASALRPDTPTHLVRI